MSFDITLSGSELLYFSEWLVRFVMLGVVIERHPPRTAMSWLLVIFFLPWPGLVLYLLIGENRLPRRRLAQRKAMLDRLESIRGRYMPHRENVAERLEKKFLPTITLAEKLGYMPIMFGNQAALLNETGVFIDRLIKDINAAQHHVHLLFYIFAADETGQDVIVALERAVARGVSCRLLVDGQGSRRFVRKMSRRLRHAGIECYQALPVSLLRAAASRIDLRNHRKIAVIDGRVAYTGSQNIVDPGYGRRDLQWYDLMVRLTGPVVLELQAVFVGDWFAESDQLLDGPEIFPEKEEDAGSGVAVQAMPSGPLFASENYQRLVVSAIHSAEHTVTITTPYFVPDEVFLEAMEIAVQKGVEVELLVPLKPDQLLVGNAARGYYDRLLENGIAIHLFTEGLLHTKSITIDNALAFLGSSNFDIRSFALNFEINMIFYDTGVARSLRRQQGWYREHSRQLVLDEWRQRPRFQRLLQNIVKLMSPLL